MNQINEEFINIVEGFFEKNPGMSLNALANKADVSEASLRRLMKREIDSPAKLPFLLKSLSYITNEASISLLGSNIGGVLGDYLYEKMGIQRLNEEDRLFLAEIEDLNLSPIHLVILSLAMTKKGISEKEAEDLFGSEGIRALLKLFELNLLFPLEGIFKREKSEIDYSGTLAKESLVLLLQALPFKTDISIVSLNKSGLKKIEKLILDYSVNINKIINDTKNEGPNKIYTFLGKGEFKRTLH
jgi:hypothetical protein